MSETRWIACFLLAVVLGTLLRIDISAASHLKTPRGALLLALCGLGVFAVAQGLILFVTLTVVQLPDAYLPALIAALLADLLLLAVILLCYIFRRKRRLTEAQKIELSGL